METALAAVFGVGILAGGLIALEAFATRQR
jgi:hypothetical protein